jgi:hypothetical protein
MCASGGNSHLFNYLQIVVHSGSVITCDQLRYIMLPNLLSRLSSARFEVGDKSKMGFTSVMLLWRSNFHRVRHVLPMSKT